MPSTEMLAMSMMGMHLSYVFANAVQGQCAAVIIRFMGTRLKYFLVLPA
jgi:hypothetical protein